MKRIFFRVDGNNEVGYGHLFRCIALSEMLKDDFSIIFIEKDSNEFAKSQMYATTKNVIHLYTSSLLEEAVNISANYIDEHSVFILDGYQYTSEYQKKIKQSGATLVCIDDLHEIHFYADIIINQAYGVNETQYSVETRTMFCLGFDWIIQRPSFIAISTDTREIKHFETIFFTLGGGQILDVAPKIIGAIEQIPQIKKIVFLKGSQLVYEKDVKPILKNLSKQFEVFEGLNDSELFDLIKTCDIAICPASVISLEACSVGIGLFAGYTATNQYDNYKGLITNKVAFDLGDLYTISPEHLEKSIRKNLNLESIAIQIENQKRIFDGKSKNRYLELFKTL